jgi:8-oxo-dGTP pyrophosphatase MutT (NUDIX family)
VTPAPSGPLPLAVAIVVQRSDGAVLIVRRAATLALGGYWTPVTGRVEPGESLEAAAHRELREETGLTAQLGPELTRGPTSNGLFELVYLRATAPDPLPPLVLQPSEVSDARWIHAADLIASDPSGLTGLATVTPMLETTRRILLDALAR